MAPTRKTSHGTTLLRAHLRDRDAREPMRLALAVGVSLSTVQRWRAGRVPQSVAVRAALERETGGAVPAPAWDE